jgi:hypothetical protein
MMHITIEAITMTMNELTIPMLDMVHDLLYNITGQFTTTAPIPIVTITIFATTLVLLQQELMKSLQLVLTDKEMSKMQQIIDLKLVSRE